jgi:hypothetical protein
MLPCRAELENMLKQLEKDKKLLAPKEVEETEESTSKSKKKRKKTAGKTSKLDTVKEEAAEE